MFVILTLIFTTVLAHSHEKHIDLLPEEEKQSFLGKFARRISTFENLDDRDEFNKELIGDQHEKHLRRRRGQYKSSEEENNAEEDFGVISLNSNKDANHDSDSNDSTSDDETSSLSVAIQRRSYDTPKKKSDTVTKNTNVRAYNKSDEKETVEKLFDQTPKEKLQTEKLIDPETSTVDIDMTTEQSAGIRSTTEFQESSIDVIISNASQSSVPSKSGDENDIDVNKVTNNIKNSLKAKGASSEKITVPQSPSKNSNESPTENLKDSELTTTDFRMLTEEQVDMISTTESQDFISEVTNYNASRTPKPNDSNEEQDLNHNKDYKFTENVSSITEGESNEKEQVKSNEKSKEEDLLKVSKTEDIKSTTESRDFKSEEINYTAYDPTTYEPNVSDDKNNQHLKDDDTEKITAKPILLLDLDNKYTTAANIVMKDYKVNKTNDEGLILTTEYLNEEPTLGPISEQTVAHKQTTNIPDSSLEDEVEKDDSTTDEASTRFISSDVNDRSIPSSSATKVHIATTVNFPVKSENLSPKVDLATRTTKPTVLTTLSPANTAYINENPKKTRFKIISKPTGKNAFDTNSANNVKKDKFVNELKEKKAINLKNDEVTTKRPGLPCYQVYEIPWPDSSGTPPFLKSADPMKKLPFPVFKNSPNYLQYNPTNRIKPSVKIDTIGREARRLLEVVSYTPLRNVTIITDKPLNSTPEAAIKEDIDIRKFGVYKKNTKKYVEETTPLTKPASASSEDRTFEEQKTVQKQHLRHQQIGNFIITNDLEDKNNQYKRSDMLKSTNDNKGDANLSTIANILKLTDEKDLFPALEKMLALNFKLMRRNEDVNISIYLKALSDLIDKDSKALNQYDWLATTVQIQSALEKLFLIIHKMNDAQPIHPADIQIIKYIMFLHNYLIELKRANNFKTKLKDYVKLLSKNKRRKITDPKMIRKVWRYIRKLLPDSTAGDALNNLNEFLIDVEKGLYDLHQAIKGVSTITKFKNQNWFQNLRQLYLTTNEKHLLQLLLHISFSRLVELIEHSCENGLEDNFITYMKFHKKESKRTLEEMVFVMMIIDEIKNGLE